MEVEVVQVVGVGLAAVMAVAAFAAGLVTERDRGQRRGHVYATVNGRTEGTMKAFLKKYLGSRKFLAALAGFIVVLGVTAWGWNEENAQAMADKLITAVTMLVSVYIGGTAMEDAGKKLGGGD